AIETLAADERFYYPDTDEGRAQILADYQTILDEISAGIDDAFAGHNQLGADQLQAKSIQPGRFTYLLYGFFADYFCLWHDRYQYWLFSE
ncbi:MAG: hypothetical protein ACPGYG_06760, partial [Candidatus Puniceispirillaceae bacterium]